MRSGDTLIPPHSQDPDQELKSVLLCLRTVYSATNVVSVGNTPGNTEWWQQRQQADQYLTRFQSQPISWVVCDKLLHQPLDKADAQQRFFAAQTLLTKCRASVHDLSKESLPSLRDSLLSHLNRASESGDKTLTRRLAMTISALAVQMGWSTIMDDLLQSPANQITTIHMLSALPEECASDRLVLQDENLRYVMRDHLIASAAKVFTYLQAILHQDFAGALQVLHIWVKHVPIHPNSLRDTPLLETTVRALAHPQHLEAAADVVIELLRMYPSHHYANDELIKKMIPLLSQLPLQDALESEDEDVMRGYCRVVTEMGESYLSLILSHEYEQSSKLVSWVIKCSRIPNQEIASITLHFWYRFVMELEMVEPYDWRQDLVDFYCPLILELVSICVTSLMKYPLDVNDLPQDMVEDLHRHRFYVSETIEDCCRLLGERQVLETIAKIFHHDVKNASGKQPFVWQGMESSLACIVALHKFVPPDESELLPYCFQLIPQLPVDIQPLRFTASKAIGKFASWLALHHELLQPLLPYLAQGLSNKECAPAAAIAIKELCECSNQRFAVAEPVLHLYQEITGKLDLGDELQILEGACRALSRQIQDRRENGKDYLLRLGKPILDRFVTKANDASASARSIGPELDSLTVIVQHFKMPISIEENHPLVDMISSIWPCFEKLMDRFPNDANLAEKICRLHKHSLRACGAAKYTPLIEPLMISLVSSYNRSRQSPYLYAASICITEYAADAAYAEKLYQMIHAMAETTFQFLRNLNDFTNHPDVVEELFYLMGRMVSHCPEPLIRSPLMQSLFQCAAVGMELDHPGANKGTIKFMDQTVSYGLRLRELNRPESQAALERVLAHEGQAIVANLARAMMGDLPAYSTQIPEIMWKFNLLCPDYFAQWLSKVLEPAPLPDRAKSEFMGSLGRGLARAEFSIAISEFQRVCQRERRFR